MGKNESVTVEVLVKVCNALDCDVVDVLEIREQELPKEKRNNT